MRFSQQFVSFIFLLLSTTTFCFPDPHAKTTVNGTILEPIIIVPGLFSSSLEIQLYDYLPPNEFCDRNSDKWIPFYPPASPKTLEFPPIFDCYMDYLHLSYDNQLNIFTNTSGTRIKPSDFGSPNGTSYIASFVKRFFEIGYTDVNIRGAPYDWRTDGHSANLSYQYAQLTNLVEETYLANNNSAVHLIGHSFGSPYIYYFLSKVAPQDWKDKYIKSFISLSGPFLGTPIAAVLMVGGMGIFENGGFGAPLEGTGGSLFSKLEAIEEAKYLNTYRNFPSLVGLMPPEKFWPTPPSNVSVLISTPSRNYTAADNLQLLVDANLTGPLYIRINNFEDYNTYPPPGTVMHCLFGYGIPTLNSVVFADNNFQKVKSYSNVSGDGSISVTSLEFCENWVHQQELPIYVKPYFNISHNGLIFNQQVFEYLVNITTHPA